MHGKSQSDSHFCLSLTEMELSKKKTNRYNNYDDISGSNDEVIRLKLIPLEYRIISNESFDFFSPFQRITKRFEVRTRTTTAYLAPTDVCIKVCKAVIQISLTQRRLAM